jgi:hypothetical protein
MKAFNLEKQQAFLVGTILTLPALYFIFISVMKYVFRLPYFFDAALPFLELAGINQSIGLNVNLLILFGPLLAFILNLCSVLDIHFEFGKDRISFQMSIRRHWTNWLVVLGSSTALLILFTYLLAENCSC